MLSIHCQTFLCLCAHRQPMAPCLQVLLSVQHRPAAAGISRFQSCPLLASARYPLHRLMSCCVQNVLYTQNKLESEDPQVLLDPNKLSEDGTVRLSAQSICLPP